MAAHRKIRSTPRFPVGRPLQVVWLRGSVLVLVTVAAGMAVGVVRVVGGAAGVVAAAVVVRVVAVAAGIAAAVVVVRVVAVAFPMPRTAGRGGWRNAIV